MNEFSLFGAFLLGIMGAGHCLAMCGGIISTLSISSSISESKRQTNLRVIFYQLGRISTYGIIGYLAGWLGFGIGETMGFPVLRFLSGLLLILMGLYVSEVWRVLTYLEKFGRVIWSKVKPISSKLLPVKSNFSAFLLGGVWGWLPCGLVYTSLSYAISLGDSLTSALAMLLFGAGTLPATILAGSASTSLKVNLNKPFVRYLSSIVFMAMGAYIIYSLFFIPMQHHHH